MRCICSRVLAPLALQGCCRCGVDRGSGIRREDPPAQRSVTSEPIDESCCDAAGHRGPRNYTLTFSRELSQVSLHHVDELRRKSDDAYAGGRLRRAHDPPPVSELGPWFRSMLCIARYSGSSSARSPRSALLNWLGHVAEPAEPVALLSSRSAERFNLNPLRLIRRPANDKDAHDRHRDLQCNGKAVSPLINSTKGLDVTPEPGSSTRSR
jgi:hypothetical protein